MAKMSKPPIRADALIDWFVECGLITTNQRVRRVVIDAEADSVVKVYVELYGTSAMLDVEPPRFSPAQVMVIRKEPWEDE